MSQHLWLQRLLGVERPGQAWEGGGAMPRSSSRFQEGEAVLCSQGILIYEAKVQAVVREAAATNYRVHYKVGLRAEGSCQDHLVGGFVRPF